MKSRSVSRLLYAHNTDMGGMPIRQALPTRQVEQVDPFLLIHHADIKVPVHLEPKHAGVGPHPHRGFSPVTFIFKEACITAIVAATTVWYMPAVRNG